MERSRILNLLGVPSWCCRYEYEEEDLGYGYLKIGVDFDPSRPGKDNHWEYKSLLFHKKKGVVDVTLFGVSKDDFDFNKLRFLKFGLIAYEKRFYNVSLKFLFELPDWVDQFSDFDDETKIAEISKLHELLVRIVNGKLYYILDITGIKVSSDCFQNLLHNTPFLTKKGYDIVGNKCYLGKYSAYPINAGQYLSVVVNEKEKTSLGKELQKARVCIVDCLGNEICGGEVLYRYNNYFYLFLDYWDDCDDSVNWKIRFKMVNRIYNIYGDLIFDQVKFLEEVGFGELNYIARQDDRMFSLEPNANYKSPILVELQDNGLFVVKTGRLSSNFKSKVNWYKSTSEYDKEEGLFIDKKELIKSYERREDSEDYLYFIFNHKGDCIYRERYIYLDRFSYNMAYFVKIVNDERKWGFLKYIDGKFIELYLKGKEDYPIEMNNDFPVKREPLRFENGKVCIDNIYYDLNLQKLSCDYPCLEHKIKYYDVYNKYLKSVVMEQDSFLYYDGKRVDLGINLYIDKNLGNGFYTALYYRHGTFNTKGNILTLDQVSFPIVNKENAPKDLFSRTAIDENLKKNIFACNFKPIEK